MLKAIEIQNFQSYRNMVLQDLAEHSMILITGLNGAGKSSIGEAIIYALFGRGRTNIASLVRDGATEDMLVRLWIEHQSHEYVVERGVPFGKTKLTLATLYEDGKKVATGSNVTDAVSSIFGYDCDLFLLTDFFGMETTDSLLRGTASARLETLQKIVNVSIYQRFADEASLLVRSTKKSLDQVDGALRALGESENVPKPDPDAVHAEMEKVQAEMEKWNVKLSRLQAQSEKGGALLVERNTLERELATVEMREGEALRERGRLQSEGEAAKKELSAFQSKLRALQKAGPIESVAKIDKAARSNIEESASTTALIELRRKGLAALEKENGACPLCGEPVSEHSAAQWREELKNLVAKESALATKGTFLRKERARRVEMDAIRDTMEACQQDIADIEEKLKATAVNLKKISSEKTVLKGRLEKLSGLTTAADVASQMTEVMKTVSALNGDLGRLGAEYESEKDALKLYNKQKREIASYKKQRHSLEHALEAYEALSSAFSRYGIPLTLFNDAREFLEPEASNIFERFFPGIVRIVTEEERGRPGISFVVESNVGTRSFAQLSEGERSILAFAVRVAVSHLLSDSKGPGVGFMFLDEITSHLAEDARTQLATVAKEVLLKSHAQIFLTSHAPMGGVMDAHIDVVKTKDISEGRIVAV